MYIEYRSREGNLNPQVSLLMKKSIKSLNDISENSNEIEQVIGKFGLSQM